MLLIEKVSGREIPLKVKDTINKVGFGLILLLAVALFFKDLNRFGIFNILGKVFK
jgi:membrane-associated protease RseP (regulator of RpoE activity)